MPPIMNYTPSARNALVALAIQFILFAILAWAIYRFAKQRHHPKHVLIAIAVGAVLGWLGGLTHQVVSVNLGGDFQFNHAFKEFFDWQLIAYIELHSATLYTFFGILASWLSLEIFGPHLIRPNQRFNET